MRISLQDTPNARLLYKESLESGLDWQSLGHEIDLFLQEMPSLGPVDNSLYLYFFESVESPEELLIDPWVGKEVVGFADLEEEEEFVLHDLYRGKILALRLEGINRPDLELAEVLQKEFVERQKFAGEHALAETWRLKFWPKRNKDHSFEMVAELQFFLMDESEDCSS